VHRPNGGAYDSVRPKSSPPPGENRPAPSRASLRGLDWFVFFLADVQTGFGPFITVYLTAQAWTQIDIGIVLSVGGLVALFGQAPGGAVVDAAKSERFVAAIGVGAIAASALALAIWPIFPVVLLAQIVQAMASCILGPALAAISLGLVGHAAIGERLGRNARYASIGTGLAAALMGACGYFFSPRYVFFCTAALIAPTLFALARIRANEIDPDRAHGGPHGQGLIPLGQGFLGLARNGTLLLLATCALLFHLANAAMLPLLGGIVTARSTHWATVLIAACIVVPQFVVASFSPWVGRQAQRSGRRPFLLAAFAALMIRGTLFAVLSSPYLLVLVQILDGIAAAAIGIMVPLIIADLTRGTGRFNLAQGLIGSALGIGASLSTTLAGYLADRFSSSAAFFGLALIAATGLVLAFLTFPETRPAKLTEP
jgi:predicted MFS family arabinose efflux permease